MRRRTRELVGMVLLAWSTLGLSVAHAATYYVAKNGNDTAGTGSAAKPYLTITKGVGMLKPGDTLLVHSGIYEEKLYANIPSGKNWEKPVTVKASPGDQVIVQPTSGDFVFYFTGEQAYIVLDGLVIDGGKLTQKADCVTIDGKANHIRLQSCEVRNAPRCGIATKPYHKEHLEFTAVRSGRGDHNEFLNCHVHDSVATGIILSTADNLVEGCVLHHNGDAGLYVYGGDPNNNNNTVRGCQVYQNTGGGIGLYFGRGHAAYNNVVWGNTGVGLSAGTYAVNASILNNTVCDNEIGISLSQRSDNSEVHNNILSGNRNSGLEISAASATVSHNLLADRNLLELPLLAYTWVTDQGGPYQKTTSEKPDLLWLGTLKLSDNIWAPGGGPDPLFVDRAHHDFHLRAGSPAIDAGMSLEVVAKDYDGVARPQGKGHDLGALEFVQK